MHSIWRILLIIVGIAFPAESPYVQNGRLNSEAVHDAYMESEFQSLKQGLERFLGQSRASITPQDEAIVCKYLGVLYAVDTLTLAKSEGYFNRLLELAPNVQIFDLYPPQRIIDFFERIKGDFQARQQYAENFDALGNPIPSPNQGGDAGKTKKRKAPETRLERKNGSSKWIWWTTGAVVAGGAIGLYIWSQSSPEPQRKVTEVTP